MDVVRIRWMHILVSLIGKGEAKRCERIDGHGMGGPRGQGQRVQRGNDKMISWPKGDPSCWVKPWNHII